ncbi:hypothetical protein CPT06_10820 [Bacillus vallismortis]|nr:hypothetical protein CPT06_10820 [Bacillus vallismortis]
MAANLFLLVFTSFSEVPAIRQAKIELETKTYWAHLPYEVSEQKGGKRRTSLMFQIALWRQYKTGPKYRQTKWHMQADISKKDLC